MPLRGSYVGLSKNFKAAITELKANMIKMTHQIVNINKDIRIIKKRNKWIFWS